MVDSRNKASERGLTESPYSEQSLSVPCDLCLAVLTYKPAQQAALLLDKTGAEGRKERSVQNVGMIIILAPAAMSSRKASGKARSQQISKPTGPTGVSITS